MYRRILVPIDLSDVELAKPAIVALDSGGEFELRELPVTSRATALLVGSEGPGLSDAALAAADMRVRIDMRPGVDSLNVVIAAAIAMREALSPTQ